MIFPDLSDWGETKAVLHEAARVVSAIPRKFLPVHEHWWQISLKITPDGFKVDPVPLPGGDILQITISILDHEVTLSTRDGVKMRWPLSGNRTASDLAVDLFTSATDLGLSDLDPDKFSHLVSKNYDPIRAARFHLMTVEIERIFNLHRLAHSGDFGQVQLWPHGFDMTIEWYGPRKIEVDEKGVTKSYPTQLNLGWSPGEETVQRPYFFSNPWPFQENFLALPLPAGAEWFTGGWKGTIFPYELLVNDPDAESRLLDYAGSVFELMKPHLS